MKNNASKEEEKKALECRDELQEELYGFVVRAGLRVLSERLEQERESLCGVAYERGRCRTAYRAGSAPGSLVLGGRRVSVKKPRVREGESEVVLPSWEAMSCEDPLDRRAMEQMVIGVSSRKYERSLESLPEAVRQSGTSKSTVSRRFKEQTSRVLQQWLNRELSGLRLVALYIDGLYVAEHVVLLCLGVDEHGRKHVLGLQEGSSENHVVGKALLSSLVERGVSPQTPYLFVIDGSKALRRAIREVFGANALVQRCQFHKMENVSGHLPKKMRSGVRQLMREAYQASTSKQSKRKLMRLAKQLDSRFPSAASSVLEGLDESLTVKNLSLPKTLERSLTSTNVIENLNASVRLLTRRVRRWQGGTMILRWVAAAIGEAEQGFRRVRGYQHIPVLVQKIRPADSTLPEQELSVA